TMVRRKTFQRARRRLESRQSLLHTGRNFKPFSAQALTLPRGQMMKRLWMLTASMAMLSAAFSAQTPPEGTGGPGARRFAPTYNTVEGQPIESRKPANPNEVPAFPGQTRAPYHRTAPFKVTVLLDNMHVPYSLGFLPNGNILLVLRLPGEMRILGKAGNLSAPLKGLSALTTANDFGLLDLALDPNFATNHRIFFTTFDYL